MSVKSVFRFFEIQRVMLSYGIDKLLPKQHWPWYLKLFRLALFFWQDKHPDLSRGAKLRCAAEELGPVFVKLGQMLSTRRDLLPDDLAYELAMLQDQVKAFDSHLAKAIIEQAYGKAFEEDFENFSQQPLASASIAQVHTARLISTGDEVVIKVIRPGIEHTIHSDIALMQRMAASLAMVFSEAKRLRPQEVVEEYRRTIIDELDLAREAANAMQLKRNFEGSKELYVPKVYSDYNHRNVMVMERIYGIQVSDIQALEAQGTNFKLLAERGVEVFFTQVFRDSFFHADMHPGNVFVSKEHPEDPQYIGIDCGIVGTLNKQDQRYLAENFLAFFNRDYRHVAQLHIDSGWVPADTKVEEFEAAIRTVCEPIFAKPLAEISFGQILLNLFNTARRFDMQVQPQLVLLQKTLLYIEGLGRQLYPQLDLWATAKPFLENWMKQQVGPKAMFKEFQDKAPLWAETFPQIPELIFDNLQMARRQQHQVQLFAKGYVKQQHQHKIALILAIASNSLLLSAVLLYLDNQLALAAAFASACVISAALCWRQLVRKPFAL
ncbi:ubiquinone biosynthesis regulatory protein kinase UbiB [Alginatibacterium sediminis]|uniref:Probable protein kinase UbiB n=1 Tax=Alginatibacterium sediminis TaxID=2164068 RepID=A0A420E767_9ALTE|nr:ubiquinone biosynthesis regulatory protein kinase UbiB [Alginatibacterium sediminis]RKF13305.1 ubiquinone biosynthesis regulatory protein kinase UbiB [Alginatibacterium sediminis]